MSVATRRRAPASRRAEPPLRRLTPRTQGQLAAVALLWTLVLFTWAARGLRSGGSVVFMLALTAALVYVVSAVIEVGRGEPALRAARKGALVVMLVLVPVGFDPKTYDVFNVTKYAAVVVGAMVVAGLWIVEVVRAKQPPSWRNGLHWPLAFFVLWAIVTTFSSINHRLSLLGAYGSYDGLYALLAFAVLFFAAVDVFRLRDIKVAANVVYFCGAGLTSLYGLLQLHDRTFPTKHTWDWVRWGAATFKGSSIWSTFGNPNHLAGFLAIMLPLGLMLFLIHRNWLVRGLIAAITAALLLEMLQTGTRGAWLATIVVVVLLGALLLPDILRRPVIAAAGAAGLVVMVVGAGLVLKSTNDLTKQFGSIINFNATGANTATQRIELWTSALKEGRRQPLVGYGPDTFRVRFPQYQTRKFVKLYGPDQLANGPHNTFMNYLATEGVPGLLAFLAILFFVLLRFIGAFRRIRRREREADDPAPHREERLLLAGLGGALVAYVGQASFNVQQIGLSATFWLLLGLLCALTIGVGVPLTLSPARLIRVGDGARDVVEEGEQSDSARAQTTRPPLSRTARRRQRGRGRRRKREPVDTGVWLAGGFVALFVVVFGWLATGPYRADHTYRDVLVDRNRAGAAQQQNAAAAQTFADRADRELRSAIAANPWEGDYVEAYARSLNDAASRALGSDPTSQDALAMLRKARKQSERALRLQPDNTYYLESHAALLETVQRYDKADTTAKAQERRVLERAVRVNPWQPRFAHDLAGYFANSSEIPAGIRVLERAIVFSPRDTSLLEQLGTFYDHQGETAKARVIWRRLLRVDPKNAAAARALGTNPTTSTSPTASTSPSVSGG